uniref:Uncharacterized protein n=1 Tax=Arundo donax TaxID=35708 RepID=A0A0A9F8W0_ARUDO
METSATDSTAVTTPQSAASTRSGTSRTSSGHRRAAALRCSGRGHCCCCHHPWSRRSAGGEGSRAARLGRPRSGGHRSMDTRLPPMGPPSSTCWIVSFPPPRARCASASVGRSLWESERVLPKRLETCCVVWLV